MFALLAASAACSDAGETVMTAPAGPTLLLEPVDNGEPTYYEYNTTLSGSGGLPGWDNPDERHSRSFKEIYRWSDYEGIWHVENYFGGAETPLGTSYPESLNIDVEDGYKRKSTFTATARNGYSISSPSSTPPIDMIPEGSSTSADRTSVDRPSFSRLGSNSEAAADARTFTPAEIRSGRMDRVVITPGGKARELERLHAQFPTSATTPEGHIEFRGERGGEALRVVFEPAIGAVIRMTVLHGDKKHIETVRRYRKDRDVWMLAAIETTMFDGTGNPRTHYVQDIRDIQAH